MIAWPRKNKLYVIFITVILILALVSQHFSRNSFDYMRIAMRIINGTDMYLKGVHVQVPRECYIYSASDEGTLYTLGCKNSSNSYLSINVRAINTDRINNLRGNLSTYPRADLRDDFIYFTWDRPGEEFVGIVDHYLILPSQELSVSGDDRGLVLLLARDISDHEVTIDPIDFGRQAMN